MEDLDFTLPFDIPREQHITRFTLDDLSKSEKEPQTENHDSINPQLDEFLGKIKPKTEDDQSQCDQHITLAEEAARLTGRPLKEILILRDRDIQDLIAMEKRRRH